MNLKRFSKDMRSPKHNFAADLLKKSYICRKLPQIFPKFYDYAAECRKLRHCGAAVPQPKIAAAPQRAADFSAAAALRRRYHLCSQVFSNIYGNF